MADKIEYSKPVPPFVRFCAANIPMVFDDSLSYYEALCALWKWLQTDVIDVINNNARVTQLWREELTTFENDVTHEIETFESDMRSDFKDLSDAFDQLKEWIDNYFENLDVQEEINNKLDEMVEAGTLQEIITTYIQSNVSWVFDTVADMKLATNLVNGSYARTLGFHSVGDGGGAYYTISNTGTANEMDTIAVENDLYAHLLPSISHLTPEMFGAYGDGTHDDTASVKRALAVVDELYCEKEYKITDILGDFTNVSIFGNNIGMFKFTDQTTNGEFVLNLQGKFTLDGMTFKKTFTGSTDQYCGVEVSHSNHAVVTNCVFDYVGHINGYFDVYTDNQNLFVGNCYFKDDTTVEGALTIGCVNIREMGNYDSENITFDNCTFDANSDDEMLSVRTGDPGRSLKNVKIQNCTFINAQDATNEYMITDKEAQYVIYDNCLFIKKTSSAPIQYIYREVQGSVTWQTDESFRAVFNNCRFEIEGTISGIAYYTSATVPMYKMVNCVIDCYSGNLSGALCYNTDIHFGTYSAAGTNRSFWCYGCNIVIDTIATQMATAVLELHNTDVVIKAKSGSPAMYQPLHGAAVFVSTGCNYDIATSLIYYTTSLDQSPTTFRLANNNVKATGGSFPNPTSTLVNSYIINNSWLGYTPTIGDAHIVSNNTVVSLS